MNDIGALLGRVGRPAEAEQLYLKAASAGDSLAMYNLGTILADQEGRQAEAELWYRKAIGAGGGR
jgi:TPR repeat protein